MAICLTIGTNRGSLVSHEEEPEAGKVDEARCGYWTQCLQVLQKLRNAVDAEDGGSSEDSNDSELYDEIKTVDFEAFKETYRRSLGRHNGQAALTT